MVPVDSTSSSVTDNISSLTTNESGSRKRPAEDVSTDEEEITKRVRALQEGSVIPSGDFYGSIISDRKKPGRKPARDDQPVDRRTAQNRAAQRAFRERKEKYVKALEGRVIELQDALKSAQVPDPLPQRQREEKLGEENRHLKEENRQLAHKLESLEQQLRIVLQSCAIAQPNLLKPMAQNADMARLAPMTNDLPPITTAFPNALPTALIPPMQTSLRDSMFPIPSYLPVAHPSAAPAAQMQLPPLPQMRMMDNHALMPRSSVLEQPYPGNPIRSPASQASQQLAPSADR